MTLTHAALVVVILGGPFAALYGVARLSRWLADQRDPIDELIAQNAATKRDGMATVDWQKADRAGERRWQDTLRGQRRTRRRVKPTSAPNVIMMRKRVSWRTDISRRTE